MYYFHLRDSDTIKDVDGAELADHAAARAHAAAVARELMFRSGEFLDLEWSRWAMVVHDADGREVCSFPLAAMQGRAGDGEN
jgi:Domain of unknown function (DUF6894)